ncbi:MAG TPA: hypothetical protein VE842_16570, partial [Pyrinomonadaceae bacterium]|nr:hypothetical protein [Pyrinomonadaceae bacterium]
IFDFLTLNWYFGAARIVTLPGAKGKRRSLSLEGVGSALYRKASTGKIFPAGRLGERPSESTSENNAALERELKLYE